MILFGSEKAWAEPDWRRRLGYRLLGELHMPGRLRMWHVMKELRRLGLWSPRPLSVLDAGGGEGAFAYFIARKFPTWRVVVADNEPATLDRGRHISAALRLTNLSVLDVDLLTFHQPDTYDLVLCTDVLEHIEEDAAVVTGLAQALKPGGVLLITSPSVPQPRHLSAVARRERRIGFTPADYGHVRQGYSATGLRSLFAQAGLTVDAIRYTFGRCGTLMFDLFFVTGDSRPNPLLYAALFPAYLALSGLDLVLPAPHGAAILGVARKS